MFEIFAKYWWQFALTAVVCYLVGNANFAVLFSRAIKRTDVRQHGSRNPGTTNMFRVFGLSMGLLTFLFDALKGVASCLVAKAIFMHYGQQTAITFGYFAGFFAVEGHVFPVFYRFRGGKGVATTVGVCFSMLPIVSLCCVLPLIAIVLLTDRMSVMSLALCAFFIVYAWVALLPTIGLPICIIFTLTLSVVIFAHRHNVLRLVKGKELPMGIRKSLRGKKV